MEQIFRIDCQLELMFHLRQAEQQSWSGGRNGVWNRQRSRRSTSSPSAAPRSTSTASRSARGWRTSPPSPSRSAAARPTSPSARRGSACKSALITRVGDEQMGRFIREQLAREGVDDRRHRHRPGAADGAGAAVGRGRRRLADDLLPHRLRRHGAVARTTSTRPSSPRPRAIVVTGTHFSQPQHRGRAAQGDPHRQGAMARKVVFDIDYRPNLWGLAGHAAGFERYVKSDAVSAQLQDRSCPTAT